MKSTLMRGAVRMANFGGGEGRGGACKVLVGKLERKRQLERLSCRWEGNIKIIIYEII
jgi:hypothetical protein